MELSIWSFLFSLHIPSFNWMDVYRRSHFKHSTFCFFYALLWSPFASQRIQAIVTSSFLKAVFHPMTKFQICRGKNNSKQYDMLKIKSGHTLKKKYFSLMWSYMRSGVSTHLSQHKFNTGNWIGSFWNMKISFLNNTSESKVFSRFAV